MRDSFIAAALLIAARPLFQLPPTQADLRAKLDAAAEDGISSTELRTLSSEAFALAAEATSRAGFWNALTLVAELGRAGPPADARAVRAEALKRLAQRDSDTLRWSSLLTTRFLPPFADIPRADWAHELEAYDETLDNLLQSATSDRVRVELTHARVFSRVFLNRHQDWLSDRMRLDAIEALTALESRFGELPVPGASDTAQDTVARRARAHLYELEHLYFGAPAPRTAGRDLEGEPLDVADHAGEIVVLDFWTTFCQPCLALVPDIRDLMAELVDDPVVYIGINGDTDRLAGLATAQRVGMTWRNLWDGPDGTNGPASLAWNVPALGWPSVFVLDPEGRIRFKLHGKAQVDADLEQAIRALLAER